jgi:hypothetical protein
MLPRGRFVSGSFNASYSCIDKQSDDEHENVLQRLDRDIYTKYVFFNTDKKN